MSSIRAFNGHVPVLFFAADSLMGKVILADMSSLMLRVVCISFRATSNNITVNNVQGHRYIVLRYNWTNNVNNYAEFVPVQIPGPGDVVLCELLYDNSGALASPTATDDSARQYTPLTFSGVLLNGFRVTANKNISEPNRYAVDVKGGSILTDVGLVTLGDTVIILPYPAANSNIVYYIVFDLDSQTVKYITTLPFGDLKYLPLAQVRVRAEQYFQTQYKYLGDSYITDLRWAIDARSTGLIRSLQAKIDDLTQRVIDLENA